MSHRFRSSAVSRLGVAGLAAGALVLALAGPAYAHNEVSASDSHALATDVTLTFGAEAESTSTGIVALRVELPQGIAPSDVTYLTGPEGWALAPSTGGYTVGGPALKVGTDASYQVKVRQLPDASSLTFKTLQAYADGRVDRWIDAPGAGADHGDTTGKPAPTLRLQPALPGATPMPPAAPSAAPAPTPPTAAVTPPGPAPGSPASAQTPTATATSETKSRHTANNSAALVVTVAVVAVVVTGAVLWWWRKRAPGRGSGPEA
ncbi:DUF1775 domain-containing protein [Yinghuangia seranimata]|uniref:DUF1775 domain-containing protein n=1 Tax=Yinghuangia seranimata TaxID=408067 RepID=UPI00248B9B77|nr:DUF1775 domain-containing protein [Yinghuangia seranimata]MDI2127243.1 DUF1775 domain-containing protein [Yinghuangia seranimata]MDI2132188.1 DUF1775 domain-containing protein [Yinghuangia seranimata]